VQDGENLAKNVGLEDTWGQLYPPDKIGESCFSTFNQTPFRISSLLLCVLVGRWVDWEIKRPYPGNAHLTQALVSSMFLRMYTGTVWPLLTLISPVAAFKIYGLWGVRKGLP
jgi:hypothetical protein